MLQILNTAGKRLAKKPWPELLYEHEFQLKKNEPFYDLPDDFHRMVNDTLWDRVESRPVQHINAQQWQEWKSGLVTQQIIKQFRIKADEGDKKLYINPTPSATQCTFECRDGSKVKVGIAFEYYSTYWLENAAGNGIADIAASTDVIRLPSDIVEAELKWRVLRSLSRPYTDEKVEAEMVINEALAQAGAAATLNASGRNSTRFPNIPETGVGL